MRVPPYVRRQVGHAVLRLDPLQLETRVEKIIRAVWAQCGFDVAIHRDGPWVRTNLIAGLPPDVWSEAWSAWKRDDKVKR